MLSSEKFNAVLAIAFFAAVSILASLLHRRRRRERAAAATARPRCWEPEDKPQNSFKRVLANNSYTPFKHLRREGQDKEISLKTHPYEEEINLLLEQPPIFKKFVTSQECPDMAATYEWIHTEQQLENLARLLSKEQIFAVDTEQHSVRSFLGFTALMQVSTEYEDFLIDTIALHDVMGILRPVFADPSICKVFHGSDNDVLWLQRDFHIYVVNMFDTAKACEVLSKPYKSLAYLLETYCGVSTDKTFQREDWRQRPLSQDMIQYARSDAHYLLYIADCLASELKKETLASSDDKYNEACRRANMVCLQLYAKEIESSPGVFAAASIYSRNFNMHGITSSKSSEIKDCIWKMCAWRDLMARIHDESLRYVLSEKAIVALAAEIPKEPMEVYDIIAEAESSCESSSINSLLPSPSPIVKSHLNELCFLLQETNANLNDEFRKYLQKHLAPTGCCPLSVYNFALSSEFSLKGKSTLFSKQSGRKLARHVGKKASRELFVQKFSCKSPVYHNCRIYASDGRLLCYCDSRKLQWYLRRDLAKLVETDPLAIMLLFEPKGRPEDEDNDFYIQSKKNICVGCGEKNHYLRYRVIPSCYRIYFPEHLKSHRSHDIVLLCVDCHEIAHCAAEKYKRQIANEFKIPLFVQKIVDRGDSKVTDMATKSACGVEEGVSPLQLRSAAMALLRHGSSMPVERRDELMQTVRDYFGGRDVSTEDLEMALLVGMSPHERRKLEKKRGIHLKHSEQSATPKIDESTSLDTIVESHESSKSRDVRDIDADLGAVSDVDTCHEGAERDNGFSLNDCIGNGDQSDDIGGGSSFWPHQASSKSLKKLSLLGHGPHGKMVVDLILQTDGEDGINQFCQRWRHVFVEAVHPRFLPSGWDVMHSGRREFGDYSVYNPAKKDVQMAGS